MTNRHDLIPMSEAAAHVPGRPHSATLIRWARRGLKTRGGDRVRLRHWRVGRKLFTTREALDEFYRSTAAADVEHFESEEAEAADPAPARRGRSESERTAAVAAAKAEALR